MNHNIDFSNRKVNILLGYYSDDHIDSNLIELLVNSDLVCLHHNLGDFVINSIKFGNVDFTMNKKLVEFNDKKLSGIWIIKPIIENIISRLYFNVNGLRKKVKPSKFWCSYSKNRVSLESNSSVTFNVADDYFLYLQKIHYWEFEVSNCHSGFRHLVLCNVEFTSNQLKNQICCIKSLKYSIKEIIWKIFVMEILFNWPIKIGGIVDDTVTVDFSDQISFIINGNFSNCDYKDEFRTLFGYGKLIPINNDIEIDFSNYLLKSITFSHEDILYFSLMFPPRKIVGPDFKDIEIPEIILDPSSKFDFDRKVNGCYVLNNKNTAKYTKFLLNDKFKIRNAQKDCIGCNKSPSYCSMQVLSI